MKKLFSAIFFFLLLVSCKQRDFNNSETQAIEIAHGPNDAAYEFVWLNEHGSGICFYQTTIPEIIYLKIQNSWFNFNARARIVSFLRSSNTLMGGLSYALNDLESALKADPEGQEKREIYGWEHLQKLWGWKPSETKAFVIVKALKSERKYQGSVNYLEFSTLKMMEKIRPKLSSRGKCPEASQVPESRIEIESSALLEHIKR